MAESPNQNVNLGCGTLILIAIIVSIFSNSRGHVENEVRQLRSEVQELTKEVRGLRDEMQPGKNAEQPSLPNGM